MLSVVAGLTCESIGAIKNPQRLQCTRMGDNHAHGPNGEKRPAAAEVNALLVARIATREVEEAYVDMAKRKGGLKGGKARASALSAERRTEIAQRAAHGS